MRMTMLNTRTLLAAILASLFALPAGAQETPAPEPESQGFDIDWANRRELRNIHKRLFLKESRFQFSLYSGVIPNDEFFTYVPVGMRMNYYFSEDLALEFGGAYLIGNTRDDSKLRLKVQDGLEPPIAGVTVVLPQALKWHVDLGTLWSPMHGKIGAFSSGLAHFDLGLAFGVVLLGTELLLEGEPEPKYRPIPDVGGYLGATLQFYLSRLIAVRVDYRHYFYGARDTKDDVRGVSYPIELSLGLSFFTSEPK